MHRRHVDQRLRSLVAGVPAVRVSGPRGCGKTTSCVAAIEAMGGSVIRLDDPAERAVVAADPTGALAGRAHPVLVDEYQHVPLVLDVIKADLSRAAPGSAGRWLLSGSVAIDVVTSAAESLGGRLVDLAMGPLTVDERLDVPLATFLQATLHHPAHLRGWRPAAPWSRQRLLREATTSGFPLVDAAPEALRRDLLTSWVRSSVLVDAVTLGNAQDVHGLERLVRAYAAATASIQPKDAEVARALDLSRETVAAYRSLLAGLHVLRALPAFVPGNARGQVVRSPKVHLVDAGLAAFLTGRDSLSALERDDAAAGALVETLVANDLQVQASTAEAPLRFHHFRDNVGEVDLVVERHDGRVLGVEVKLSSQPGDRDLRGLRRLRDACGDRWLGGVLLARVPAGTRRDDDLVVAPIEAVWHRFG